MLVIRKPENGFTIVELLIVIVVIGILASIVITSFNGMQTRAQNAARIQTVKQFRTALNILATTRPTFDDLLVHPSGPFEAACFSRSLPDFNGDGVGDCHIIGGIVYASESAALIEELNSVSSIPSGNVYPPILSPGGGSENSHHSPFLYKPPVDGTDRMVIEYSLVGNQVNCGLQPVILFDGSDTSYTTSNPTNQKYSATEYDGNYTVCIIDVNP